MDDRDASPLNDWQQGDIALEPLDLPYIVLEGGEVQVAFLQAPFGVAILSQTCEIQRSHHEEVHVAALFQVTDEEIDLIERGDKPHLAIVPGLRDLRLAMDLNASAAVSKEVVVGWARTEGCPSDGDRRRFAQHLARHRQRFAFPDRFNEEVLKPLKRWVERKRRKGGAHGEFIRATEEFRILCDNWINPTELLLLAILKQPGTPQEIQSWEDSLQDMLAKGDYSNFPAPEYRLATFDEISAREYLTSDRLDWDGLSDV